MCEVVSGGGKCNVGDGESGLGERRKKCDTGKRYVQTVQSPHGKQIQWDLHVTHSIFDTLK